MEDEATSSDPVISGDVVTSWNAAAVEAVDTILGMPPPLQGYFLSLAHVCIFDAVNSVTQDYSAYAVNAPAPAGASAAAAGAAAGYTCLHAVLPPPTHSLLDATYADQLASIPDGQSENDGVALGQSVANQILSLRSGDGPYLNPNYAYTAPPTAPGVWVPTPADNGEFPPFLPGLFAGFAQFPPWTMSSPSQFRPGPPPALTSPDYTKAFKEVKEVGSFSSTKRTADQTNAATWWNASGILIWNAVGRTLSARNSYTLSENARLFALLNMAAFDGNNATFDAKYFHFLWRPVTAIRQANTDGNPNTSQDPNWRPLHDTPPFPEYTSGHAGFTGAASTLLELFFPTNNGFSMTTPTSPNQARTFQDLKAARKELIDARVWSGIHYRFSDTLGVNQGRSIARQAVENFLNAPSDDFDFDRAGAL